MGPTAKLWVQNTILYDKPAIPLHPGTRWNKNFASPRQNYEYKMQDVQVKKPLHFNTCCLKKYIHIVLSELNLMPNYLPILKSHP